MSTGNELNRVNAIPDYFKAWDGTGMISPAAATYLHAGVLARQNILLVGPPGCGKNMLLNALGKLLPENSDREFVEDTPGNCHFIGSDKNGVLRIMNVPDQEILEVLLALNSGQMTGITALQAVGLEMLLSRIFIVFGLSKAGRQYDLSQVASLIAGAFRIAVDLHVAAPRRYIKQIGEFTGKLAVHADDPDPEISILFQAEPPSFVLKGPLGKSLFEGRFRDAGIDPAIMYLQEQ